MGAQWGVIKCAMYKSASTSYVIIISVLFVTLSRQLPSEAGAKWGLFAGNGIAAVDHCSIAKRLRISYVCRALSPAHTALCHPEAKWNQIRFDGDDCPLDFRSAYMCFSALLACFWYCLMSVVLFLRFPTVPHRELRGRPTADPHLPATVTSQLWSSIRIQSAGLQSPSRLPVSLRVWDGKRECQRVCVWSAGNSLMPGRVVALLGV